MKHSPKTRYVKLIHKPSSPVTDPCKFPYRINRNPPAFVEIFPPIWQLPFAPKSKGTQSPFCCTVDSKVSSTTPDWHVTMPEYSSMYSILFIEFIDTITSSKTGTDPPTCWRLKFDRKFTKLEWKNLQVPCCHPADKLRAFVSCNISWSQKLHQSILVAKQRSKTHERFASNQRCNLACHHQWERGFCQELTQIVQHLYQLHRQTFHGELDNDPTKKMNRSLEEKN